MYQARFSDKLTKIFYRLTSDDLFDRLRPGQSQTDLEVEYGLDDGVAGAINQLEAEFFTNMLHVDVLRQNIACDPVDLLVPADLNQAFEERRSNSLAPERGR